MVDDSEELVLIEIQHEWADARVKGDSSYTRRLEAKDCTIVWPDSRIVNNRGDLQSMRHHIRRIENSKSASAFLRRHGNRDGRAHHQCAREETISSWRKICVDRHICETGWRVESRRFTDHSGLGKIIPDVYPLLL